MKKETAVAAVHHNISDTALNRQLMEERASIDKDRIHFEKQLFDNISRVKRLVKNINDLVTEAKCISRHYLLLCLAWRWLNGFWC